MTTRLEKLNAKMEQLTAKKQQLEQDQLQRLSKLILEVSQKGVNLQVLAGLILNAPNLVTEDNKETWQKAGKKFLLRQRPQKISKTSTALDADKISDPTPLNENEKESLSHE